MTGASKITQARPAKPSRRRFVALTGAGIGMALVGSPCSGSQRRQTRRVLKQGDKIDINGKGEEIIDKACELGHEYEKKYGGCAQCALAALQDAIPFVAVDKDVFRAASCLDGGATPTGIQNCGAFTGSGMVIGHLCGRTRKKGFQGGSGFSHNLIRKVYQRFKDEYGSVLCQDVRKGAEGDCPKVVGTAAKWAAEVLLKEFADYEEEADG